MQIVASWAALVRPDIFRTITILSSPFEGPPALPFDTANGAPAPFFECGTGQNCGRFTYRSFDVQSGRLRLSYQDWADMVGDRLDPMRAVLTRRLRPRGNPLALAHLAKVFPRS